MPNPAYFGVLRRQSFIALFYVLSFFSGAAALGYQMVWSKMFATGLGHEMPAVLAVVGAFMGGMALGSWSFDGVIARSLRPGRWLGWLEIVIGLWAALSAALIPLTNQFALALIGLDPPPLRHWSIAFVLPLVALVPVTAAMGATLPAMERFIAPLKADRRCVSAIYAANTLGAVAGILASTFLIAPALGFRSTILILGAANILCGLTALGLEPLTLTLSPLRGERESPSPQRGASDGVRGVSPSSHSSTVSRPRLAVTVFATGLFGIGYEVVGMRVLSQVLENTVYTFAAVLSVFLLGTSIGAALYQRSGRRYKSQWLLTDLLAGVSLTCLLGIFALWQAQPIYDAFRAALSDRPLGVLVAEMAVAATVFLLPTLFMGAAFGHLVQAARRQDGGVGQAAALNTFGGAVAPALFGVFLLPLVGSKWTLVLISLGYLFLLPRVAGWRWGFLVAAITLLLALPVNLHLVRIPSGGQLVEYHEGVMGSVAVVEDATRQRVLRVNNRFQMGGTAAANAEYRQAHIPLLLHPAPKRALVLGLGTGITLGGASLHPAVHTDGVELVPEVLEAMRQFEPHNFSPQRHPRLRMFVADARRFVRTGDANYDVIIADLFHPAREGEGFLYTREHFEAVRRRLAPGGLFCQWLPLHQLDETMLRVIVRTFLEVFPETQAWLLHFNVDTPVLGLIGSLERKRYSTQWVEQRLADPQLEDQLKRLSLGDSMRLFGNWLAGPQTLRDFADQAPLNTDDRPRVAFGAPQFVYRKSATPYGRLLRLLAPGALDRREVLDFGSGDGANQFAARLTKYLSARDGYLKGLVAEAEGRPTKAIDAFVESARASEDFTPGYAHCLTLASLLAKTEPAKARALLQRLIEAQPSRPVARELLKRLFEESDSGTRGTR